MGIFDWLPWKKKDEFEFKDYKPDSMDQPSSSDPFSQDTNQAFNNQYGSNDPFSSSASQDQYSSKANYMSDPNGPIQDPFSSSNDPFSQGSSSTGAQSQEQYPGHTPFPGQQSGYSSQQFSSQQNGFASGSPQAGNYQETNHNIHYEEAPSRDVELILAKLDAIKAELDSVHQRVRNIEKANESSNRHSQQSKYSW